MNKLSRNSSLFANLLQRITKYDRATLLLRVERQVEKIVSECDIWVVELIVFKMKCTRCKVIKSPRASSAVSYLIRAGDRHYNRSFSGQEHPDKSVDPWDVSYALVAAKSISRRFDKIVRTYPRERVAEIERCSCGPVGRKKRNVESVGRRSLPPSESGREINVLGDDHCLGSWGTVGSPRSGIGRYSLGGIFRSLRSSSLGGRLRLDGLSGKVTE